MSDQNDVVFNASGHAAAVFGLLKEYLGPELEGRAGGFLCVTDKKGLPVLISRIGEIPEEKLNQYYRNALEKARRLAFTHALAGHLLSRQSRDEKRERWTGAIVGKHWIWSFSGLLEPDDEVLSTLTALRHGDLSHDEACQRMRAESEDENPRFKKLYDRTFIHFKPTA